MAGSPRYKLFTPSGEYVASSKQPELLAACIGLLGQGAKIKDGRNLSITLWIEGIDGIGFESYDYLAETCYKRQDPRWKN